MFTVFLMKKSILIASIFVLLIAFLGQDYIGSGEHTFNYMKAKIGCIEEYKTQECETYTPLFHILASPFTFQEKQFWFFCVFLFGFIMPLSFYYLTKHWISVWLFISSTSAFYYLIDGVYPQALAMLICILIFAVKDWRWQSVLVLLATMAHGHGFWLGMTAFTLNRAWIILEPKIKDISFRDIMLGCSSVFGLNKPEILDQQVQIDAIGKLGSGAYHINFANILSLFTKIFPLPFWIISIWYSLKYKIRWDMFAMALIALVFAFTSSGSHRSWYLIPLMFIPALSEFYINLSFKYKCIFLIFTIGCFVLQIWMWFNYKTLCQ